MMLKEIGKGISEIFFALVTLIIVWEAAQWFVGGLGVLLLVAHHWFSGILLICIAFAARWLNKNLQL